jgi:hypothetical protein
MGLKQITIGFKEQNSLKKKSGIMTFIISLFFLLAAAITYVRLLGI